MASIPLWLEQNWLNIFQSAGIVGSLFFTAYTLKRDSKARQASDILKLSEQHRELWAEVYRNPELRRITDEKADLILSRGASPQEEEFLNLVFVHTYTTWLMAKNETLPFLNLEMLGIDMGTFLKKPVPLAVWKATKAGRDPEFVKFMEQSIATAESSSQEDSGHCERR